MKSTTTSTYLTRLSIRRTCSTGARAVKLRNRRSRCREVARRPGNHSNSVMGHKLMIKIGKRPLHRAGSVSLARSRWWRGQVSATTSPQTQIRTYRPVSSTFTDHCRSCPLTSSIKPTRSVPCFLWSKTPTLSSTVVTRKESLLAKVGSSLSSSARIQRKDQRSSCKNCTVKFQQMRWWIWSLSSS